MAGLERARNDAGGGLAVADMERLERGHGARMRGSRSEKGNIGDISEKCSQVFVVIGKNSYL